MIKLLLMLLCFSFVYCENFSEMSTQELIAIMGYVKPAKINNFKRELNSRLSTMNASEKKEYLKNVKKMK